MPLTLVSGRANTGKTGVIHDALRSALAAGSSAVLLLPTAPDVRRVEAELGQAGVVGARIAVLDDWIDQLWALFGDGRRVVTPPARIALMCDAVRDTPFERLSAASRSRGFVSLLASVVQRLTRLPDRAAGEDAELLRALHSYDAHCARLGLVERAVACRILGESPPALADPILVNRFTDLSEAQELLLQGLSRTTQVVVALTWEPDLPATAALDPLVERMFADAEHIPLVAPAPTGELEQLEDRLYCPGEPLEVRGQLEVALAAGEEAECVLAARAARSLLDEGVAPERIAIVFRDTGRRLGLLAAELSAQGVAADLDVSIPVTRTSFGAAFVALMDAATSPSRERLLAYLLSPYSDATGEACEEADVRWRRYRVPGERLLSEAGRLGERTGLVLRAARRAAAGLDGSTAEEWKRVADLMLACAAEVHERESVAASLDAAAHRALLRLVDDVSRLSGTSLDVPSVCGLLSQTPTAPGAAERSGSVQITEAHRIRSRRFDALILGGLTADEFSAERQRPLAAEIAQRLGSVPGMAEREAERMLFYLVVTRARRRLVLIRQECDVRGEALRPSVFWDEVVDVYASGEPSSEAPIVPPGVVCRRLGLADLAAAAPAFAPGRREERAEWQKRGGGALVRGSLADEEVLASLTATPEFSVTELETYLACPYRWFFDRAVRPREIDAEFDARERGSRAHALLAAFYVALEPALGMRRVVPERLGEALELLDEVAEQVAASAGTTAVGLREELTLAQATAWARQVVEDDAHLLPGFAPVRHELTFGADTGSPFGLGGIALRGSVDRVDEGAAGLVITDYKSGSDIAGCGSFAGKGLIQVPIYAAAAADLLGRPVIAGAYRSLRSLAMRGFRLADVDFGERGSAKDVVTPDELAVIVAEAADRVSAAAEGIRSGDISPRPARSDACTYCRARPICTKAAR